MQCLLSTCLYGGVKTHVNLLSPGVAVDDGFSRQIIGEQRGASLRWECADRCLAGVGRSAKRLGPSRSAETCAATAQRRRVSINTWQPGRFTVPQRHAEKYVSCNYSADEVMSWAGRHTAPTPDSLGASEGIKGQEGCLVISHRGSRCVPRRLEKGQLCSWQRDFTRLAPGGDSGSLKACVRKITPSLYLLRRFPPLMFPINVSPRTIRSRFKSSFKWISSRR